MAIEGVDIRFQVDLEPGPVSFVTISVHLQDTIDNELHGNWEFAKKLVFNTGDPSELNRLLEDHPLSLIRKCESPPEVWFYIFAHERLPGLMPQVEIGPYRTDFGICDKKIVIEIDGHEYHKTQEQRTRDAKRERYLQLNGWRVIRFTALEVFRDRLACVEEAVRLIESMNN